MYWYIWVIGAVVQLVGLSSSAKDRGNQNENAVRLRRKYDVVVVCSKNIFLIIKTQSVSIILGDVSLAAQRAYRVNPLRR